jgi:hypothetical protein
LSSGISSIFWQTFAITLSISVVTSYETGHS